ncbi:aspartate carbamoyltransferase catalytic subunit [Nostoc sp. 2RC]|uniref:aspartate carbamoyltransferase catalytic subunit n=1 Tax=Nostoc sp. 2RC TaxID=2485484 RepID=UPI0016242533|nr:aspartate carbamoyltransferase catalytic subunit [Nostoc sp. 2RC]MBC1236734.1 aspartate carbamoyltransferase catalytic subunit [Nostoc sp. 2RC]
MPTTTWNRHHVLSLADFKPAEYDTVLQTAASFQEVLSRRTKKVPTLQGQVVANLFFEPSTRTRSSFELAAKRLSADTLNFAAATSSMTKGETILDTAKTYLAMGTDIMVVRHKEAGVPNAIAAEMDRLGVKVSVLNAGDGQHEHPSQALLDLFTICSLIDTNHPRLELLQGKKIAIVGDILHSRVARSNIWSFIASGAQVHLAAPPTLLPKLFAEYILEEDAGTRGRGDTGNEEDTQTQAYNNVVNKNENFSVSPRPPLSASSSQLFLHWQLEPALQDADFVMTLRLQKERMTAHLLPSLREYHQLFGITRTKLQLCKPHVKVLHPGPVNRGVEISSELMDDPEFSLIQSQVTSGVAVRMALLYLLGSGKA